MLRLIMGITVLLMAVVLQAEDGIVDEEGASAAQSRIYKQTMPDGSVQFTDKPVSPGAEPVDIRSVNTVEGAKKKVRPVDSESQKSLPPVVSRQEYAGLAVSSPQQGATIRNPVESIPIEVVIKPQLQPGDQLELTHNGRVLEGTSLDRPERGAHQLQARILNAEGEVLIESEVVEFYIHRTTVGDIKRQQQPSNGGDATIQPGTSQRPVQPLRPYSARP
ncbi:MAG: hypothetical protein ACFE0K_04835 [Alcanivorax sp.]|uniref:hypothetical protein n=1 Tax=Alcanivorax sp. TaxID=1872427 RepID=UPI003DA74DC8